MKRKGSMGSRQPPKFNEDKDRVRKRSILKHDLNFMRPVIVFLKNRLPAKEDGLWPFYQGISLIAHGVFDGGLAAGAAGVVIGLG